MRLRLVEIEGTPEEIARLDIEHLLGHPLEPAARIEPAALAAAEARAGDLDRILRAEAPPGRSLDLLREFFTDVTSWGDVTVAPSWKSGQPGRVSYLRVHRHPRTRGAFVYVFPARLRFNFRLDAAAARDFEQATARQVKADNAYQVSLVITDESSLDEARRLARLAYESVGVS